MYTIQKITCLACKCMVMSGHDELGRQLVRCNANIFEEGRKVLLLDVVEKKLTHNVCVNHDKMRPPKDVGWSVYLKQLVDNFC